MAKSIPEIYLACAKEALACLRRNWRVVPASFGAMAAYFLALRLLSGFGLAGGLLLGMLQIFMLSAFYDWISRAVEGERLKGRDFFTLNYPMFIAIINVGFIFFIVEFLVNSMIRGLSLQWISLCLSLAITLVFNPVAEVIMTHQYDGMTSLRHTYEFVMKRWIEWFIPLALLLFVCAAQSSQQMVFVLSQSNVLLPISPLLIGAATSGFGLAYMPSGTGPLILLFGLVTCLGVWFMFFRLLLFRALDR